MYNILLNYNKPIILIDSSYYVFYRYFATYKWYSMQKKLNTYTENEFAESFIKHMQSDIKKISKKWKSDTKNIIFCADCPRSQIWRNDIYTEYKTTRQHQQNFNQNIFNVFYDYIEKNNLNIININRLEADDVVYLIHNKIKNKTNNNIIIITNDNDYLQLICDNTDIVNMQFKNIKNRTKCINGLSNLYYKSLIGDKSDNIPKVSSNINKELALQLSSYNIESLENWLKERNLYDKFMFNLKLISFAYIPNEYNNIFENEYTFNNLN